MGTKQLVVHDALEMTTWASGSKSPSLTPTTKVASASPDGPEMMTRCHHADPLVADDQLVALDVHRGGQPPLCRVVAQQMGQGVG